MEKILSKKVLSVVGMIVGFVFIIVGILSMAGALGGEISYPGSAPYSYDSGYAQFGADYYSYSVNNSAEAASAARAAAYNLGDIAEFLAAFFGIASILFGLMVMCGFGIVLSTCMPKAAPSLASSMANGASNAGKVEAEVFAQE